MNSDNVKTQNRSNGNVDTESVTDSPLLKIKDLIAPTTQQENGNKNDRSGTEQPSEAEQSPMILTPITPNRSQLTPLKGILKRRGEMPTPIGHKVKHLFFSGQLKSFDTIFKKINRVRVIRLKDVGRRI